jgi:hypothetical protein
LPISDGTRDGERYCRRHHELNRTRAQRSQVKNRPLRRQAALAAGLCGTCLKRPLSKFSKSSCEKCVTKAREWARKKNGAVRIYHRRTLVNRTLVTRESATKVGMCRSCLRRPIGEFSKSLCEECVTAARQQARERAQEKRGFSS